MFQHGVRVLHQKILDRQGAVCWHNVLVKNPWAVLPHFRSPSSHPFTKVCQNLLVVDLVIVLNFRHQSTWKIPRMSKKMIIIALNFDLLCCAFFCLHEVGLFRCMDWRLLSGSYWNNQVSSQVIMFSKKYGSFSMFWRMSAHMFIRISFCSGVRSLGTIFKHIFFMLKLLHKICQTVSLSMLINSANAQMLRGRFCWSISPTFSMLASVFDVLGWPGHWSSPIPSLHTLNLLNHLKTWVWDTHHHTLASTNHTFL